MGKPVNVRRWEDVVRQYGCVVSREVPVQLHHVKGRTYKTNKVLVGPYYILPLAWRYHDVHSNHEECVTHFKHRFQEVHGRQQDLFFQMVNALVEQGKDIPVPDEVLDAIAGDELPW